MNCCTETLIFSGMSSFALVAAWCWVMREGEVRGGRRGEGEGGGGVRRRRICLTLVYCTLLVPAVNRIEKDLECRCLGLRRYHGYWWCDCQSQKDDFLQEEGGPCVENNQCSLLRGCFLLFLPPLLSIKRGLGRFFAQFQLLL